MKQVTCGSHKCRNKDNCKVYFEKLETSKKYTSDLDSFKCGYFSKGYNNCITHETIVID